MKMLKCNNVKFTIIFLTCTYIPVVCNTYMYSFFIYIHVSIINTCTESLCTILLLGPEINLPGQ